MARIYVKWSVRYGAPFVELHDTLEDAVHSAKGDLDAETAALVCIEEVDGKHRRVVPEAEYRPMWAAFDKDEDDYWREQRTERGPVILALELTDPEGKRRAIEANYTQAEVDAGKPETAVRHWRAILGADRVRLLGIDPSGRVAR